MKKLRNILWGFLIVDVVFCLICMLLSAVFEVHKALAVIAFNIYYFWIAAIICAIITLGLILFRLKKQSKTEANQIIMFSIYVLLAIISGYYFWIWNI
ncbi:MAG: hypothetical protein J1F01_00280 [Oscillospiraceae bacterium]|nr:hypothetical protein [Oscillospiraceae bacterium]